MFSVKNYDKLKNYLIDIVGKCKENQGKKTCFD